MRRDNSDLLGCDIPEIIGTAELCDLLGIGERQAFALAGTGVLKKAGRGKFDARESIKSYIVHSRKSGNSDLDAEKIRVQRETADKLELANAATRRELIPAIEVEREWASILRDVRAAMLAISSRLQQRLPHLSAHDASTIDREIRDTLTEVAK